MQNCIAFARYACVNTFQCSFQQVYITHETSNVSSTDVNSSQDSVATRVKRSLFCATAHPRELVWECKENDIL